MRGRWYGPLRRSGEILFVRRTGRRAGTGSVSVHVSGAKTPPSRVAVSVSKAVGAAVCRNLVKRRIKGALDELPVTLRPQAARPVRLVVVARPQAATLPYAALAADVRAALARVILP